MSKKTALSEEPKKATEGVEDILYLSLADIQTQREEWAAQLTKIREIITSLNQQIVQHQQQEIALDGAIQAADVFSKKVK